jgi:hypothetical protein
MLGEAYVSRPEVLESSVVISSNLRPLMYKNFITDIFRFDDLYPSYARHFVPRKSHIVTIDINLPWLLIGIFWTFVEKENPIRTTSFRTPYTFRHTCIIDRVHSPEQRIGILGAVLQCPHVEQDPMSRDERVGEEPRQRVANLCAKLDQEREVLNPPDDVR